MVTTIPLTKGDVQVPVTFVVVDANGNYVDLTNTSNCKFKMALPGGMIDKTNSNMTVLSASLGTCQYVFTQADLTESNMYNAELQLTYVLGNASGRTITVDDIQVVVSAEEPQ